MAKGVVMETHPEIHHVSVLSQLSRDDGCLLVTHSIPAPTYSSSPMTGGWISEVENLSQSQKFHLPQ